MAINTEVYIFQLSQHQICISDFVDLRVVTASFLTSSTDRNHSADVCIDSDLTTYCRSIIDQQSNQSAIQLELEAPDAAVYSVAIYTPRTEDLRQSGSDPDPVLQDIAHRFEVGGQIL